jgi:CHAT domain-containing protein
VPQPTKPRRQRGLLRVRFGCCGCVGRTAGVPQKADDALQRASRRPRAKNRKSLRRVVSAIPQAEISLVCAASTELVACNTSAADKPGAEALSGLARAFFYAGARALLVSHWSVDSEAATRLTTATFSILKADPRLGRAEALRNAMLAYMNDSVSPLNAYPAFWGPFPIIGEGAVR